MENYKKKMDTKIRELPANYELLNKGNKPFSMHIMYEIFIFIKSLSIGGRIISLFGNYICIFLFFG